MNSNKYSSAVAERSLVNSGRDCAFHPRELASDLVRGQSNKQHRSYGHLRCCPARNGDDHRCAQGVGGGVLLLLHVLVGQNAQWSCNNNDTEHKDDAIAIVVYLNAHRHRSWLIKTPTTKTNTWHRHHHDHHSARWWWWRMGAPMLSSQSRKEELWINSNVRACWWCAIAFADLGRSRATWDFSALAQIYIHFT